jgi:hypothetical protein
MLAMLKKKGVDNKIHRYPHADQQKQGSCTVRVMDLMEIGWINHQSQVLFGNNPTSTLHCQAN